MLIAQKKKTGHSNSKKRKQIDYSFGGRGKKDRNNSGE